MNHKPIQHPSTNHTPHHLTQINKSKPTITTNQINPRSITQICIKQKSEIARHDLRKTNVQFRVHTHTHRIRFRIGFHAPVSRARGARNATNRRLYRRYFFFLFEISFRRERFIIIIGRGSVIARRFNKFLLAARLELQQRFYLSPPFSATIYHWETPRRKVSLLWIYMCVFV